MRKLISILMALALCIGPAVSVHAADKTALDRIRTDTAQQVYRTVKNPQIGTVGGEWAMFGLARSGYDVPQSYYDRYYRAVVKQVRADRGVLDPYKYTEYSRVILGLTAAGFDPRNVGGYDLTLPLGDFDKTVWQGLNGPIYALIALDSAGYETPQKPGATTPATRDMYIRAILDRQLPDGGFALHPFQKSADADITGMALQALAKYREQPQVEAAIDRALNCLSEMNGEFTLWGEKGAESVVQTIVALCELDMGIDDPRFVENGLTLPDQLMKYYIPGQGFARTIGGEADQMTTEQALYALAALYRWENDMESLYDMAVKEETYNAA